MSSSSSPDVVTLLSELVAIDSVNPALVPGAAGEAQMSRYVANWLENHGFDVHVQVTGEPGRNNVIGIVKGSGGPRLMLNGHMDTVGVAGITRPHDPEIVDGRLYGRGALDTKGGLAAFMVAAANVAAAGNLRGDVVLTAVVDEEFASLGTETVLREWSADFALVAEPTALDLTTCHKGFVWLEVQTEGTAAHGSRADLGVDAIAKMGAVLGGLDDLARRLSRTPGHPLLGSPSIHASLINGGQELSSYPATCTLGLERRTLPGETADDALREVQDVLDQAAIRDPRFAATARITFARNPLPEAADSDIARHLSEAAHAVLGRAAQHLGSPAWMDAALLAGVGIPTVVFGPAGEGLHAETEWVDLDSVVRCAEIVESTISRLCL